MKKLLTLATLLATFGTAHAQFLSEIFVNPDGADTGGEYLEIMGTPGQILNNTYLVVLEGDGGPSGIADVVFNLSGLQIGSNGVLLIRDTADVLVPAPEAGTNVVVLNFPAFSSNSAPANIENGTNTYILATGPVAPTIGFDYDNPNDGTLDASWNALGLTILDAVAYQDGPVPNLDPQYAAQVGGVNLGQSISLDPLDSDGVHDPDGVYRVLNLAQTSWYAGGGTGRGWITADRGADFVPGPFVFDPLETDFSRIVPAPTFSNIDRFTPGVKNIAWPAGGATISGTATFSNHVADYSFETITIEFYDSSNTLVSTVTDLADAAGAFSTGFSVPNGSYTVRVKGDTTLRKAFTVVLSGGSVNLGSMVLANGNANGDTEVGPADFSVVLTNFGNEGDPNATGDLDGNTEVGPADFSAVLANFGGEDE